AAAGAEDAEAVEDTEVVGEIDRAGGAGAGRGERADRRAPEGYGRVRRRQRIAVGVFDRVRQEADARDLELGHERRGAHGQRIDAVADVVVADAVAVAIVVDGEGPRAAAAGELDPG